MPHGRAPLDGIRVLDLSSVVMGPFATQVLGDLGADVIAVEQVSGDINRVMGKGPSEDFSDVSLNLLRNKRNLCIDIKNDVGHELLLRLIASCDAVVTNFRPGVLERAKLTYEHVREVKQDIIFCQAHGYPSDSPLADDPAYDDIVQAASGVADAARLVSGTPALMPTIMADKVCALTIVYSVVAALFARERTGEGQHIEVPMVDTMSAFMLVEHSSGAVTEAGGGSAGYPRLLTPHRRPQETTDGWINVLPYSDLHYDALFADHAPELVGDKRYATARARIEHSDFLYDQVRQLIRQGTTQFWLSFCRDHGIPASPVVSLDEIMGQLPQREHPLVGAYRYIPPPVRFAGVSSDVRRHAPRTGEHTREVLAELGVEDEVLRTLEATRVIQQADDSQANAVDGEQTGIIEPRDTREPVDRLLQGLKEDPTV